MEDVTWFDGIDGDTSVGITAAKDVCETLLSIGPRRYSVCPVQRLPEQYMRAHQLAGRLNSDAHNSGGMMGLTNFKYNKYMVCTDLERAHPGSGAQYTGERTRHNDLVTVHVKNPQTHCTKMYVIMVTLQILEINSSGATVLD